MPAEWEPQEAVWVAPPHNAATWPGCLEDAQAEFGALVDLLSRTTAVRSTADAGITTDDSWIRDYGPLFVVYEHTGRPVLGCYDFRFNCWGGKYAAYGQDDLAARRIAEHLGVRAFTEEFVLEGGAIDVNGRGTILTTRQCLLEPDGREHTRNPGITREQVEATLHRALCGNRARPNVIWLAGGIDGDDTDGHVDDVARFVNPDTVVAVRGGHSRREHEVLERNWSILEGARDQDGQRLNLVELPAAAALYYDYPAEGPDPGRRARLPASYANFLISNGQVLVPVFGTREDEDTLRIIEGAMPGYAVTPVPARWLVVGLGAVHCLTMQQPVGERLADD